LSARAEQVRGVIHGRAAEGAIHEVLHSHYMRAGAILAWKSHEHRHSPLSALTVWVSLSPLNATERFWSDTRHGSSA
jgi:hypothetical protein